MAKVILIGIGEEGGEISVSDLTGEIDELKKRLTDGEIYRLNIIQRCTLAEGLSERRGEEIKRLKRRIAALKGALTKARRK